MKAILNPFTSLLQKVFNLYSDLDVDVVTKTSDYTITKTDHVILVDASSGNKTITLPKLSDIPNDKIYHIKKIDSSGNTVTVAQGG